MTLPYQEMKDMKKHKEHNDMLGYICDAQNGIPTRCPCGGVIQTDISLHPKYRHDFDTHPGTRYFTCKKYEDDGMHFRQPWAFAVEDEVRRLRREVDKMAEEIANLRRLISSSSSTSPP